MKTIKLTLIAMTASLFLTSCNESEKEVAQENVDRYTTYVDSISQVSANEAIANWETIEKDYEEMKADADNKVITIEENADMQIEMDESTLKYETFKANVIAENERMEIANSKMIVRKALLGNGYNGDDMTFTWINKDNILGVYQNFVDTVEQNKDTYSREDWDEIKLLYEAIDTRKNTVENEGLKSDDNGKIAGLKLKFAPMYTFNRMGAKSEENAAAKE